MNSITYPYLSDLRFLKELDELNIKEQFVKIIVLDWLENPIANIEGRVSGGSMNLDGASAVRRSGSITFICDDEYYNVLDVNNLISINKKIKIEIGYANATDKYTEYDKIWFPQGVFVIINPSITHNNQGLSISISFKDKMCLLNGECGGVLPASVTFHEREEEDGTITRVTYYQIIRELVSEFGGEQLGKIIINDVDTRIKKVMKWVGDEPITLKGSGQKRTDWLFIDGYSKGSEITAEDNAPLWSKLAVKTTDEEDSTITITCTPTESEPAYSLKIVQWNGEDSDPTPKAVYENLAGPSTQTLTISKELDGKRFGVQLYDAFPQYYTLSITVENPAGSTFQIEAQPQDDIGYIYTDFCPTSDLVGNAGQNVVTILDNIKKQLGNYEYFYDIDGNFIFQEIRNYLNTSQSTNEYDTLISQGYLTPALTKSVYQFTDSRLITAYQNTPQYANIKNDFIVWGVRESAAGAKMPIRYHVAFDTKPYVGNTYYCFTQTDDYGQEYISRVFSPKPGLNKTITTNKLPEVGRGDAWYIKTETAAQTGADSGNGETTIPTSDFYLFNCTLIAKSQAVQMNEDFLYEFNFDHDIALQPGHKYIIELSMLNRTRFKTSMNLPESTDPEQQYHISGRFNGTIPFGDNFYLNTEAYTWYFVYSPNEQGTQKPFKTFSFDSRPKNNNYEALPSTSPYEQTLNLTTGDFVSIYSYIDNETEPNRWKLFEQNVSNKDPQPKTVITQNYQTELYIQGVAMPGSNRYYSELAAEWPKMFQLKKHAGVNPTVTWRDEPIYSTIDLEKQIPANPDYYLDIIEPTSKVGEFSIPSIGVRSKVWNDNAVNCIFETDPPDIVLVEAGTAHTAADRDEAISNGDSYYQVPSSIYNALAGGGYQNSAFNAIRDVLYQYTNYNESITLTALPIYYLEPNTRITVEDEKSSIHGDYMIKSISRPFDCNGTMQITATKALERF